MELLAPSSGVYVPLWLGRQSSTLAPPMSGLYVPAAAEQRHAKSGQTKAIQLGSEAVIIIASVPQLTAGVSGAACAALQAEMPLTARA
eukprot:2289317-Prymnesium_polylepis.2